MGSELVGLQVGEAPIGLAVVRPHPDALPVGLDGLPLSPDGLERMTKPQPGASMARLQLQRLAVGIQGILGSAHRRQRRCQQVARLGGARLQPDGALETLDGLRVAVLLLKEPPQVEKGEGVVRGKGNGLPKQRLRLLDIGLAGQNARQQAHGIHVVGRLEQQLPVLAARLLAPPRLVVLGRQGKLAALRIEFEGSLEGGVRLFPFARHGQRPAQREEGHFRLGIQPSGGPEHLDCRLRPTLLHQQAAEVLVGFGEGRRQLDGTPQVGLRGFELAQLQEDGAQQRRHVDVLRILLHGIPA